LGFIGNKELPNELFIPAIVVDIHQLTNFVVGVVIWFFTPSIGVTMLVDPVVSPYISTLPIPNGPIATLLKDPSSLEDAPPGVTHMLFGFCFEKGVLWEVLGL
jgi:hypothetical protein